MRQLADVVRTGDHEIEDPVEDWLCDEVENDLVQEWLWGFREVVA